MDVCKYRYIDGTLRLYCYHSKCLDNLKPLIEEANVIDVLPCFNARGYSMLRHMTLKYIRKLSPTFISIMHDFGSELCDDELVSKTEEVIYSDEYENATVEYLEEDNCGSEEDIGSPVINTRSLKGIDLN